LATDKETSSPERRQTDSGLRTEREQTDKALEGRQATIDAAADVTVQKARVTADAVLDAARDAADRKIDHAASPDVHATLVQQRQVEDEALRSERAAADASLREEREATARTLASLLPLEREKTDRSLLTERARSDECLAHRDDFLGIISHDLRNLLGGIVMSSELLARLAAANEQRAVIVEATSRIQRYVARMNRLVGDLVDVASIEAGKLTMETAPGDMAALLAEAVDMFHAAAAAKEVELELEAGDGPLIAEVDHDRALQVLANVITNAIKFTPSGGSIRVRGEQAGGEIRIAVRDTGEGIPGDLLTAIFDRFWQVGPNDQRGLGLGLYISRSIVEAHGGKIWAESTPGAGSTLWFTLPVTRPGPERAGPHS
jgi:signal transduction histidine kinase